MRTGCPAPLSTLPPPFRSTFRLPASTSIPTTHLPSVAARLSEVAERAQSLTERLDRARAEPPRPGELETDLLAGWARAFSGGDFAALERRLAWDGLDLARAALALGAGGRSPMESRPPWLDRAVRRFALGEDGRPGARARRGQIPELDLAAVPFGELWAPVVAAALAEAAASIDAVTIPERDLARLAGELAKDIGATGSRAAHERYLRFRRTEGGEGAPGAYRRYVESELSSGLLDFAVEFPVALRQIARLVDTWIAALVELAGRIEHDRAATAGRFARASRGRSSSYGSATGG